MSRCRVRRRYGRGSLQPGDDLIPEAQVQLGRVRVTAREIALYVENVGNPLGRYVGGSADDERREHQLKIAGGKPASAAHLTVERGEGPAQSIEQAQQPAVSRRQHRG